MRLVSVNVSSGTVVPWRGRPVETGIFKQPVAGRVMVRGTNVDGDRQADLTVHGGEFKAVYAYAAEHYDWWRRELRRDIPYGMFGENLTTEGLDEEQTCVGDVLQVGGARLEAVQPRLPCFKLGLRFEDPSMVRRFMDSGRLGIYFRIVQAGDIGAGDDIAWVHRDPTRFPVPHLVRLLGASVRDPEAVRRALGVPALPPEWAATLQRGRRQEESA